MPKRDRRLREQHDVLPANLYSIEESTLVRYQGICNLCRWAGSYFDKPTAAPLRCGGTWSATTERAVKIEPIKFCWRELDNDQVCERIAGHKGECSPDPTVDFPIASGALRHRKELPDPNWLREAVDAVDETGFSSKGLSDRVHRLGVDPASPTYDPSDAEEDNTRSSTPTPTRATGPSGWRSSLATPTSPPARP